MDYIIDFLKDADLATFNSIRNNSREFLHDSSWFSLNDTIDWFEHQTDLYYAIRTREGKMVGYFRTSDWDRKNKTVCIGADIDPEYRGKGIAKQSYPYFMRHLFDKHSMRKVWLEVLSFNERAIGLYNSLGFVYEGAKRAHVLNGDGIAYDSIIMSMLREEYQEKYGDL